MAGQTDASDDLIAELAKLMADSARAESKQRSDAAPVRVPGSDATPSLSALAQGGNAAPVPETPEPVEQVQPEPQPAAFRIPGEPSPGRQEPDPFQFDFGIGAGVKGQDTPAPQPGPAIEPEPETGFSLEPSTFEDAATDMPDLDHDSLAELIAAELDDDAPAPPAAASLGVEPQIAPEPNVDSFRVAPVFGLASTAPRPVEPAPVVSAVPAPENQASASIASVDGDPLEEIERLIGPAASIGGRHHAQNSALRSLATPTLPPAPKKEAPAAAGSDNASVDDAILAAAAATGAKVEWVEAAPSHHRAEPSDALPAAPRARRVFGISRNVAAPLVALTLLVAAGLGLFFVLGNGEETPGTAPLLVADTAPVKEVPPAEPESAANQQSVVFNEISGNSNATDEQIVSRDQSDADIVNQAASADIGQDGLVNRKVRTVTVRPDGTIVSGEDGLAGAAMLPVDRPDVPDVPGADFSTPELIANAPSASEPAPAAVPTPSVVPVQPGTRVPAVDLAGNAIPGRTAPVPMARPDNLDAMIAERLANAEAQPQQVFQPAANAGGNSLPPPPATNLLSPQSAPAPVPAPATPVAATNAAPASTSSAPAYVQLSSQRSEEAARQSAVTIASRFGGLFGGVSPQVSRVDLGERGIFYRVLLPADSLQTANAVCNNVKAAGGDCFAM